MLIKVRILTGYGLNARDGEIGKVKEFYFDDQYWGIRYLVADTGNWLTGQQVLISPHALLAVVPQEREISIDLTKKQIEDSPSLETHKPVSKQFEEDYYGYYGWPIYWGGPYMWGFFPYLVRNGEPPRETPSEGEAWDPHLRSTSYLLGHTVHAVDGDMGHIEDIVINDETWDIRYFVVDTKNWWPGKKVLISIKWIESIGWDESKVFVGLTRKSIQESPEFTDETLLTQDYEATLVSHYQTQENLVKESNARASLH